MVRSSSGCAGAVFKTIQPPKVVIASITAATAPNSRLRRDKDGAGRGVAAAGGSAVLAVV